MKRAAVLLVLTLVVVSVLFHSQSVTGGRTVLFIMQVFPQVPIKPLDWITRAPAHEHVAFDTDHGRVIGDLFLPRPRFGSVHPHSEPAIIIAQGVKVPHGSMSGFLSLGDALARMGYVVLFPRLRSLAQGRAGIEEPSTYLRSFTYLAARREVDPHRISYLGISVGSSIALVAAADARIRRRVHALVFFAGYYNVFDYLVSVATKEDLFHGREIRWNPSTGPTGAVHQTRQILGDKRAQSLLRVFKARTVGQANAILRHAKLTDRRRMERYNPAAHRRDFLAPTFILDDTQDTFVPYVESEKLVDALPKGQVKAFLLSSAFQHVMPGPGGLPRLIEGFFGVFDFVYEVLSFL